ncbi:MAG: hypothetical protein SAK29_14745 [Scytonema sp. PMC 1069.18]|nr:hypothetical protein [Scytonema sp. PMC 1069.18]MEC4886872.1 hypothetical protein [Scytonema sp. PMC 1070.18]
MADAVDLGLVATGGLLPGWRLAQAFAPGGFDPNFYRRQNTGSFAISLNRSLFGSFGNDVLIGGVGNDYISGYGFVGSQEIDILAGNLGADTFALGDFLAPYYGGPSVGIIADYKRVEGDIVQLSGRGVENYSFYYDNLLGSSATDTFVLYNNDVIGIVVDTTNIAFNLV